jgi:type I restriction enzyme S subunit
VPEREVWAFGSRVKGTARKFSDLDLAILGEAPLPLPVVAALANDFDDSDLPVKVDIVDWALVSPAFREIIREDAAVLQRAAVSLLPSAVGA